MLFNGDWREDLRVLRLNNPSYRPLFILFDVVKWSAYLAGLLLFVAFCWKIISPRAPVQSLSGFEQNADSKEAAAGAVPVVATRPVAVTRPAPVTRSAPVSSVVQNTAADSQTVEQLSQDRVDYLKSFASRARQLDATRVITDRAAHRQRLKPLPEQSGVTVHSVPKAAKIEAVISPTISPTKEGTDTSTDRRAFSRAKNTEHSAAHENAASKADIRPNTSTELHDNIVAQSGSQGKTQSENQNTNQTTVLAIDQTTGSTGLSAIENQSTNIFALAGGSAILPVETAVAVVTSGNLALADAATDTVTLASVESSSQTAEFQAVQVTRNGSTKPEQPVANPNRTRAYRTSDWILSQNRAHYTIQIGATVNRPFLLRFLESLPTEQDIALFKHRINRSKKEVYVLSYGSFTGVQQANEVLASLSQSNRRYGAYVRSFGAIQREIKKVQAVTALALPVGKVATARRDL